MLLDVIKDYFANAYSTLVAIVDNLRITLRTLVRGDVKELAYFSPFLASLRMSFDKYLNFYKVGKYGSKARDDTISSQYIHKNF